MNKSPTDTSAFTDALISRAIEYQHQGRLDQAESALRKALDQDPLHPDALHLLGLLEFKTDRRQDGLDKMRRSVELAARAASPTRNASLSYSLASALLTNGQYEEALAHYRRCVDLEPENGDAWQRLATSLCYLDRPEEAADSLTQALAKLPGHAECWLALSRIQKNMGMLTDAVTAARHAIEPAPQNPEAQVWLASLLLLTDRTEEATSLLASVISAHPRDVDAHFERAKLWIILGKFPEACAELETVLSLNQNFTHAYIRLASINKLQVGTPLQKTLENRVQSNTDTDPTAKRNIHFALGKAWESAGNYERAFGHFAAANQLRRASFHYSSEENRKRFEHIRSASDANFLARTARCGQLSTVPIFIVGMPRSGTSLVEQILSRHPQVHAGGELKLMSAALHHVLGPAYRHDPSGSVFELSDEGLRTVGHRYLADLNAIAPSTPHITDKLPGNFLRLGLIHILYPEARIVHCVRDARDTCVSLFTTLLSASHDYTSNLAELGAYYCEYLRLMQHWRHILPAGVLLDFRYEDLIEDTEKQVRRLLAHCGLSWDPACLQFTASKHPVRTASAYQVRKPIYHSSIGRWRHYKPYLHELFETLRDERL